MKHDDTRALTDGERGADVRERPRRKAARRIERRGRRERERRDAALRAGLIGALTAGAAGLGLGSLLRGRGERGRVSRALPSQGLIGVAIGAAASALALGAVTRVGAIGWAWGDPRRLASGRIDATALDAETEQRVEHELFVARGIPAGRVNVTADRGTVTIRGAAGSRRQADEIVRATETVAGVDEVRDELLVPGDGRAGAERSELTR